ncbi:tetratricopeptide repeat protein [Neptunitalea lumnitzerae]|uniref:Tetratricopeptide repeat protein n=1 Tax=Neptunitalea lumnitzerae TaxID=2965509 RepID=A0ABQ5MET3_9FLAO|nr:hypothetical protein [Neptunitalea sp. Y10]GLB47914.1 hypothetical protein Y10_02820 [Neptunitalea sp. Y10]
MKISYSILLLLLGSLLLSCSGTTKKEADIEVTKSIINQEKLDAALPRKGGKSITIDTTVTATLKGVDEVTDIAELYALGDKARMQQDRVASITYYKKIVEQDASQTRAHELLADNYMLTGNFKEALAHAKILIQQDPTNYKSYTRTAMQLELLEQPKKAEDYYASARRALKQKEAEYWKKVDTLSMVAMLVEVLDTTRAKKLVTKVLENPDLNEYQRAAILNYVNGSHDDVLNRLKSIKQN